MEARTRALVPECSTPLGCQNVRCGRPLRLRTTGSEAKLCQTVNQAASLIFSKNANHSALYLDLVGRHDDRSHFGIGRLQANLPRSFAVETFQRSFILSDQCHYDVASIS